MLSGNNIDPKLGVNCALEREVHLHGSRGLRRPDRLGNAQWPVGVLIAVSISGEPFCRARIGRVRWRPRRATARHRRLRLDEQRGYSIEVRSDGSASVSDADRGAARAAESVRASGDTAKRFFADLAAARKANAATAPCMKSASFGSSTHVTWQGWTSPDLSCPPNGDAGTALVNDVDAIHAASGMGTPPLRQP